MVGVPCMGTYVQPPLNEGGTTSSYPANGAELPSHECLAAILQSLQTMKDGDFSTRLPGTWIGFAGKIADIFNEIVTANEEMARELKRVGQAVGKEGKTRERIRVERHRGAWDDM